MLLCCALVRKFKNIFHKSSKLEGKERGGAADWGGGGGSGPIMMKYQCCQVAEIPAKNSKEAGEKRFGRKNSRPNFQKGPKKIFLKNSLYYSYDKHSLTKKKINLTSTDP
jgi:hypothetical protein